jgi:hypothetical protein
MPSNWFRTRPHLGEQIDFGITYDNDLVNYEDGSQARIIRNLECTVLRYWQMAKARAVIVSRLWGGPTVVEHVILIDLHASSNDRDLVGQTNVVFTAEWQGPPNILHDNPQIALVLDGVWQEDPMQAPGTHNFNFAWNF